MSQTASAASTVDFRRRPMRSPSHFAIGNIREMREGQDRHIVWRSDSVVNPHVLTIGASGVGKTHRMRSIVSQLCMTPDVRIHVVDVHDDLSLQHASSVEFTETGHVGINPLRVSSDRDFGGPRKKIRAFISMLNRTSWNLGPKQEAVLVNLLQDLYYANGFLANDFTTWDITVDKRAKRPYPRRQPALSDLRRFAEFKLKQRLYGMGSDAVRSLERVNQTYRKLERTHTKGMRERSDVDLDPLKQECIEHFTAYLETIESGTEISDLLRYDSTDVIKSVTDRVITLESIGVFKDEQPDFDAQAPIWRYRVHTLSNDEQRVFVDVLIEDLFFEAKRRGPSSSHPHTFIILDEAHKFLTPDEDHILNIGMREARKFGLSFILASQSITEFPEMVLANAATKIILGVDSTVQDATARRLKIDSRTLGSIIPRRTALTQIRQGGNLSNEFHDVTLV